MGAPKASAGGRKPRPPHEEGGESTPIPAKSRRRQKTKNSKNGSTPKSGRAKSEKGRTRKWLTEMEFHAMDTGRHETAAVIPSAPTKATCLRGDGPRHSHFKITTGTPRLRHLPTRNQDADSCEKAHPDAPKNGRKNGVSCHGYWSGTGPLP